MGTRPAQPFSSRATHRLWLRLGLALAMLALLGGAALEEEMSEREFERAGLDKLTDEELAFLNEYLGRPASRREDSFGKEQVRTAATRPPPAPAAVPPDPATVAEEPQSVESQAEPRRSIRSRIGRIVGRGEGKKKQKKKEQLPSIHTRIKGEFNGWSGQTLFVLENGQRWRQRVSGVYRHRAQSPAITIIKGRFGYYLIVDKTKRRIGVKRVL